MRLAAVRAGGFGWVWKYALPIHCIAHCALGERKVRSLNGLLFLPNIAGEMKVRQRDVFVVRPCSGGSLSALDRERPESYSRGAVSQPSERLLTMVDVFMPNCFLNNNAALLQTVRGHVTKTS